MFPLDTNALSAMMAAKPPPEAVTFISAQPVELLFTASICQAEILSGIAIMTEGRRRLDLEAAARAMFLEDFEGRVLPFDQEAAIAYAAAIFAACRRRGRPAATIDLMIAAIASCRNASGSPATKRISRPAALPSSTHGLGSTFGRARCDETIHIPRQASRPATPPSMGSRGKCAANF
ncbi:MAG: PIN domain-containing protein [Beijerinckiaceae bacterium]|nr:PIN domain-containing protein [Beijerinckiaceae bacterium]